MTCSIEEINEILARYNVTIKPNSTLSKLVKAFSDSDVSLRARSALSKQTVRELLEERKSLLNKIIAETARIRTALLTQAYNGKVPKKFNLEFHSVEVSDKEINAALRTNQTATRSILNDTIEVGRARGKQVLSDFLTTSTKKLSRFFQHSLTLVDFIESKEGQKFLNNTTVADNKVIKYLFENSQQLTNFIYGSDRKSPIYGYMDPKQRDLRVFGLLQDQASHNDALRYLLRGELTQVTVKVNGKNKTQLDGDLSFDPLVIDAMNQAVFNWVSSQAQDAYFNDRSDVNSILGRDSKTKVSATEMNNFGTGTSQAIVIDNIGTEIYRLLGFKQKTGDEVEGNFSDKLKVALGEMGVAYLLDTGVLTQRKIDNSAFPKRKDTSLESNQTRGGDGTTIFLEVANRESVNSISNDRKGAIDIDELLGVESYKTFPSFKASDKIPNFMRRTLQRINDTTGDTLKKLQKDEWEVKSTVADLLFSMGIDVVEQIAGVDESPVHVTQEKQRDSVNDRIRRSIEHFQEFQGKLKNKRNSFFMKYFVSKTGRIFIDNNTIDPINDKMIRHLIGLKNFNVEVNSKATRQQFKLAVAQAFGYGIDKKSLADSITEFDNILNNETVKNAVRSIRQGHVNDNPFNVRMILEAVAMGGEKMHTFEALVALADYDADGSFSTSLPVAYDAVTSGVAIGMMQSLLDGIKKLPAIGVFVDGVTNTFPSWKSKIGNQDLYQQLAVDWHLNVKKSPLVNIVGGIEALIKPFSDNGLITKAGRDFSKSPLMFTNYGAAIQGAIDSFSASVLEEFYSQLVKSDNPLEVIGYAQNIIQAQLNLGEKFDPRTFTLIEKQTENFLLNVSRTYGNGLSDALKSQLGKFLRFRENINQATRAMFFIFEKKFNVEKAVLETQLKRTLSIEELETLLDEVRKFMPIIQGPLSTGLDTGIAVLKGGLRRNYTPKYTNQQQYTRKLKGTADNTSSLTSHARGYEFQDPGVSGTVVNIHNMDSAIQQAMLSSYSALNIHDAGLYSLTDAVPATKTYNQSFFDTTTSFNIMKEVASSLNNVMRAAQADPVFGKDAPNRSRNISALLKDSMSPIKQYDANGDLRINPNTDTPVVEDFTVRGFQREFADVLQQVNTNKQQLLSDHSSIVVGHSASPDEDASFIYTGSSKPTTETLVDNLVDQILNNTRNSNTLPIKKSEVGLQKQKDISEANRRKRGREQSAANIQPNETDSLYVFLQKLGGIDVTKDKELHTLLVPYNESNRPLVGAFGIAQHKKGNKGLNPGKAAELAIEARYMTDDQNLIDVLQEGDGGLDVFNSDGLEANEQAALDFANRVRDPQQPIGTDQSKLFGSSSRSVDFDNFTALFTGTITSSTINHIFQQLANIGSKKDSQAHTERLQELLDNMVRVQGSIDLKVGDSNSETFGAQRTFSDGTQDIHILGSASTVNNNAQLSAQEVYLHELIHAVIEFGINSNVSVRNALKRLFTQAEKHFNWKDFLPEGNTAPNPEEIATAKETYAYIFKNTKVVKNDKGKKVNAYLHEFVAYGLTNARFIKKLSTIAVFKPDRTGKNLYEKILNWFSDIINNIVNRVQGVNGLTADKALRVLTDKLLTSHQTKTNALVKHFDVFNNINERALDNLNNFIFKPMMEFRKRNPPTHVPGRILHTMAGLLDEKVLTGVGKVFAQVGRNIGITERSFITKLVREMQGLTEDNAVWHSLLRMSKKTVDQARLHEADNVKRHIKERFHDSDLTEDESQGVYKVFMKLDLVSLLNTYEKNKYSPDDVIKLLTDNNAVHAEILKIEQDLNSSGYGENAKYYIEQAQGLGNLIAKSEDFKPGQMSNAHLIATLKNVGNTATGDITKATLLIDELASLYGLLATAAPDKIAAARVYTRENAVDGVQNGITNLLYLHNLSKQEALERVFSGNPAQTTKGYTRETFNPNIDIKVSPLTVEKINKTTGEVTVTNLEKSLLAAGYVRVNQSALPKDPADTFSGDRYLFVNASSSNASWVKSIVSLTNKQARGHEIQDILQEVIFGESQAEINEALARVIKQTNKRVKKQFAVQKNTDTTNLLPIVDDRGKTTGYRYIMSDTTKDKVMQRDNRFDYSMGRMFSSITDKENSKKINSNVLKLLKEDFDKDYLNNASAFVDIGPQTSDKELSEIYQLLPQEMKDEMKGLWGKGEPVFIKEEFVNLVFGFRKMRVTDMDNYAGAAVRGVNRGLSWIVQNTLFPEAPNADIGKLWGETVEFAKENIVIRTGVILLPNFISNNILLFIKGVSPKVVVKAQTEALVELDRYRKDLSRRDILARDLKGNTALKGVKRKNTELELARLEDDLSNNPVAELIDEGIFQSIIEDINFEEDIYSSRAKIGDKAKKLADTYLPEFLTTGYQHLFLTQNTKPYQLLLKATQVSDFMARYALFKHRMDQIPNGTDVVAYRSDTLREIVETFVNYDIPTSREMQYINDIGLLMFTKFYFRIQKIILRLFTKRPASTLGFYMIEGMLGDMEDISDSMISPSHLLTRMLNAPSNIMDTVSTPPAIELLL